MSTLSNIISGLKAAGITGTDLTNVVSVIAANSPTSAIQAACNPAVVKDMTTKIAEIANLPIAVANLLPTLQAAQTPLQVVEAVQAIETAMGPHAGGLNLGALP